MTSETPAAECVAPLVSVLIPVYNGEAFIADAIRSVQRQTYQVWDLTVVNNQSEDRTREIALEFARTDPRIHVHDNAQFLNVVDNHNMAFSMTSPQAKYAKILGADDWLFPGCLQELVAVAEQHPSVGMVTSYVLAGAHVGFDGLPYPSTFMSGRDVCRLRLLKAVKCFGGPSASLIRADVVREKQPFYNPKNYHGDTEAYLELLQNHDFGFVHQVLAYHRRGEDSRTTSYLDRVESYPAADVQEILKFGPIYLSEREREVRLGQVARAYYRFLADRIVRFPTKEFLRYHFVYAQGFGVTISKPKLALHVAGRVVDLILNPKKTVEGLLRRVRIRRAESSGSPPVAASKATSVPSPTVPD